jgi:hypothetical protein
MPIRDNKFDEFTLLDKISKINIKHALVRWPVSRHESTRICPCPRMKEDRTYLSTPNHAMHTLQTSSTHAQFYRCVRHRRPPHTTGVYKFLAHKGNPSNRNINMPSKRHLSVYYYSQVIDRVNTIKDDTTQHPTCTKIQWDDAVLRT